MPSHARSVQAQQTQHLYPHALLDATGILATRALLSDIYTLESDAHRLETEFLTSI